MKNLLLILFCFFSLTQLLGQDNVGIGTSSPNPSAALDVQANNKGVLFPRVTTTQRIAITGVEGLLVFDTDSSRFYFHDGFNWVDIAIGQIQAENGLKIDGGNGRVKIGAPLIEPTFIEHGNFSYHHNLTGSGDFKIQDNGVFKFGVMDNGKVAIGSPGTVGLLNVSGQSFYSDKLSLRNGTISSPDLIRINRENDNGVVEVLKNGVVKNKLHADSSSYITGGNFGIGTTLPNTRASLELNSATDGFLPTRTTRAQMDATPLTPLERGMLYYDVNSNRYNQWDGTQWNELRTGDDIWQENTISNYAYYPTGNVVVGSNSPTLGAKLTVKNQGASTSNTNYAFSIENTLMSSVGTNYGLYSSVAGSGGATQTGAGILVNTFANPTNSYGLYMAVNANTNAGQTTRGSFLSLNESGSGNVYGHQSIVNGGSASSTIGSQLTARTGVNQSGAVIGSEVNVYGSNGGTNNITGSAIELNTGVSGGWSGLGYGEEITVRGNSGWSGSLYGSSIRVTGSNTSTGTLMTGQFVEAGSTTSDDPAKVNGVFVRANAPRNVNAVTKAGHFYARKGFGGTNTDDVIAVEGEVNDENSTGASYAFYGYNRRGGDNDYSFYSQNGHAYFDDDVRIGDENDVPGYKVSVKGGIIADSLRLLPFGSWPDYVFDEDYKLLSLEEVKAHIELKKHLPGIPSATEIENQKGIELFEMNKLLLEKIEELTLHAIRLNEENKLVKSKNENLNQRLGDLESEMKEIREALRKQ